MPDFVLEFYQRMIVLFVTNPWLIGVICAVALGTEYLVNRRRK